jgi:hypothetical protein
LSFNGFQNTASRHVNNLENICHGESITVFNCKQQNNERHCETQSHNDDGNHTPIVVMNIQKKLRICAGDKLEGGIKTVICQQTNMLLIFNDKRAKSYLFEI